MNWNFLLSLLKDSNIDETLTKTPNLTASFIAARDIDEHGNIVGGLIAGLQRGKLNLRGSR